MTVKWYNVAQTKFFLSEDNLPRTQSPHSDHGFHFAINYRKKIGLS